MYFQILPNKVGSFSECFVPVGFSKGYCGNKFYKL